LATVKFRLGGRAMLLSEFARFLTVQIEPVCGADQTPQIRGARGVTVQGDGQGLARENAGNASLDIGLDAQLQRPIGPLRREEGGEMLLQQSQTGGAAHLRCSGHCRQLRPFRLRCCRDVLVCSDEIRRRHGFD
jgi:hypothetical protein